MAIVLEYVSGTGEQPFSLWFNRLHGQAAARVTVALARLETGNLSAAKSVGGGLLELRLDFGPGYRIYYGMDGPKIVILLGGGTKQRQQQDIETARERWNDYKRRKT
jgi:putative addiction module killer protein